MNNEIIIKDGVVFKKINLYGMLLFDVLIRCGNLLHKDMVITSANDGVHHGKTGKSHNNSLHYRDTAWDIRTHHLSFVEKGEMEMFLKRELGNDYDVLFEAADTINEHIHVEYDPK
jgi:hypothetical protein